MLRTLLSGSGCMFLPLLLIISRHRAGLLNLRWIVLSVAVFRVAFHQDDNSIPDVGYFRPLDSMVRSVSMDMIEMLSPLLHSTLHDPLSGIMVL